MFSEQQGFLIDASKCFLSFQGLEGGFFFTMPKVIVYSTDTCPFCHLAKDFFNNNKIEFKDVNVGTDQEGLKEMMKKSGQTGVPVIDIDGKIIVGFNEPAVKKALGL